MERGRKEYALVVAGGKYKLKSSNTVRRPAVLFEDQQCLFCSSNLDHVVLW